MYGSGEELIDECALGLCNRFATFSLLFTLVDLVLRSNAEFPFLQQQGREEIFFALHCAMLKYLLLGYENRPRVQ